VLALGQLALVGADQLHSPFDEAGDVLLRRGVLPHTDVHGRGRQHRATKGQRGLREDVVGQPVRELRQGVGREGRDHEEVGVHQVWIQIPRAVVTPMWGGWWGKTFRARQSLERVRGHEALGIGGQERRDLVAGLDEQTQKLTSLVGRDAARHTEEDAGQRRSPWPTCRR
jgi:hypothetical protein